MQIRAGAWLKGLAVWLALAGAARAQESAAGPAQESTGAAAAAAPRIRVSGTLEIHVSLVVSAALPSGTMLNISAGVSAMDAIYDNEANLSGTAKVAGGKAALILRIPYTWLVASTSDKVTLNLFVNGNLFQPFPKPSFGDQSNFNKTIALPKNGSTTVVSFSGSI
jgi:hypothetical protein